MLQLVVVFIAWKTKGVNFNVVSFLKSEAANPQVKITYKLTIYFLNNIGIKLSFCNIKPIFINSSLI